MHVGARDDELVRLVLTQDCAKVAQLALREDADEVVVDAAASTSDRAAERLESFTLADEERAPAHAGDTPQVRGHDLVARAQENDRDRGENERGDVETERGVLVPRADREDHGDDGDEKQRRHDAPGARTPLARRVQPCLPEHEDRDERQERQPVLFRAPEQAPKDRFRSAVELAQHEREIERARETGEVEQDERGDAHGAPPEGADLDPGRENGRRADVGSGELHPGTVARLGADNRLGRHESGV